MKNTIGIRVEDKYLMERRVALIPSHIKKLKETKGLCFKLESSPKRVFTDAEFADAGAEVVEKLEGCDVVMGVKEMPSHFFEADKTYVFFSHVIKGQPYNMPMLKRMMEMGCNLIDYEKVTDEMGRRLIFFGRFAGLAGMINSLWSYGQRLKSQGTDTPFAVLKQSHKYNSLAEAKEQISKVGMEIAKNGLPADLCPMVIGFTGYGNVSNGAQEIAALLPIKEISPEELLTLQKQKGLPQNVVYKVVFKEADLSEKILPSEDFDLQDYYQHPEAYKSIFEKYIPHMSILMNCMYWDDRYPRIFTKEYAKELFAEGNPKIKVIGDVTCDPDGSIEFTHKGTEIEDPVFVYDPESDEPSMGFDGKGILVMAVDILPSELPRESSLAFSNALFNYVEGIAKADYKLPFNELELPGPVKRAMILHKGRLTPDYEYIQQYLK